MCTWMSSDEDFFVLRKFETVGARVLLFMQDQIVALEEKLQQQDDDCKKAAKDLADSGTFRQDRHPQRGKILHELSCMLERYRKDPQFQAEASHMAKN